MKRLPVLMLLAAAVLLVAGAPARADYIPWSYSFSASPGTVTSNDGSASVAIAGTSGQESLSFNGLLAAQLTASGATNALFTDIASQASADLSYAGAFSGTTFNLTNKIPNPSHTVTLGNHGYTVNLGEFVPPTSGKAGGFSANVVVTGPSVPVSQVPEPASLLLAALGGSAVGLRAWWRRRGVKG
jgi:hypothetical protein